MLRFAREGDTVRVHSMDRLGRSLHDLLALVKERTDNGVGVHFLKEDKTFRRDATNPYDVLQMQLLGAFAEFERNISKERQREGIATPRRRACTRDPSRR